MKQIPNLKSSDHLLLRQLIRIILAVAQLISCLAYLIWVDINLTSIRFMLIFSLVFPLLMYFFYWMRTISKVEMKNRQVEVRRSTNPTFKKLKLFISWIPLCLLMSAIQKLQISGYVIFHYIYKKFGIMLTQDFIELMSAESDQRVSSGTLNRLQSYSKQNTYVEFKQNININSDNNNNNTPLQQQVNISTLNNFDSSPKKNYLTPHYISNNNPNNNNNNSRVINPIQLQLQPNSKDMRVDNRNNSIRKKIIPSSQPINTLTEQDSLAIINTDNNNYNTTPIKKRPLQLEIESPVKKQGRYLNVSNCQII